VGDALASHASEWGAGMIVMGGFGHSQFRESILGGVSRDLLAQSAWPLFMAH
ncbi:MAG: universal stress protein, partial [Pseudomonadota bacterium]